MRTLDQRLISVNFGLRWVTFANKCYANVFLTFVQLT